MSEEQNIPGNQEAERLRQDAESEEQLSDLSTDLMPSPTNPKPSTEMEVHHHGHVHHQKKWREYFFQFFMLFLAVFCGFLAEYQLEHLIEKSREKQFMASMAKDLEQDIRNIQESLAEKKFIIITGDSLTANVTRSLHTNTRYIYYYARQFATFRLSFYMTDGTLAQLKNSGGLRLIRNQGVVDSLQAYDNIYHKLIMDQQLEEIQVRDYRDIMIRIFDVTIFNTMIKTYPDIIIPEGNPAVLNTDPLLINEFLMRIHLVKRNKLANIYLLNDLLAKAQRLKQEIKAQYHFN